ncbi:MAG: 50S ribosomal protein L29 [Candidatus Levybacteria bacterium RIFOXYA1_FULL_41_10]|nr:MAG: 50S ribosomal protein L29 [Candidatus Levybacteria bacterium GW2011_GWA1_39_34]KKR50660.1 MAG: 50S ribosomal protein L29 [Candidatus Levybacteria bacterium GW2011_GWC1_40_19]KKR72539.1 MAG: 50S ribosomal protein L29 [Candidatus Levybacteria bacterium GW2011_GWC2_40_7]KKR95345.1 MAG: 50S ribosomal protein L29 [Candidatus Levybacteria bacterium GW2011_GWA2_41_15]KKS01846.1 MAG: 50S ribosomal protein L29 [Candidatus Levybacteria bacterium GW2011_GWB1_41_21]OGH20222.1 MAG: 50S ribosomal pr
MKIRIKKDLRTKSVKELSDLIKENNNKIFDLRIEKSQNKLKNTREIFNLRKDVARMLTFIQEKEASVKGQE